MKRKIKALEKPADVFFTPVLTKEASEIIDTAKEILSQHIKETAVDWEVCYSVRGSEDKIDGSTCCNEKCIRKMKKNIRKDYGKYTRVVDKMYYTCGDYERIVYCRICGKPINDHLTWIEIELENIESEMPWNKDVLIGNAFEVNCIFESVPSLDCNPSVYDLHEHSLGNSSPLKETLAKGEEFFQRVVKLAEAVIREVAK